MKYCPQVLVTALNKNHMSSDQELAQLKPNPVLNPKRAINDITKLKISLKSGYAHLSLIPDLDVNFEHIFCNIFVSLTILPTENYNLPFMGHKIPYLSSLLVTCHQSSRLSNYYNVSSWRNTPIKLTHFDKTKKRAHNSQTKLKISLKSGYAHLSSNYFLI